MPGDTPMQYPFPYKNGDGEEGGFNPNVKAESLEVAETSLFYGDATFLGNVNITIPPTVGVVTSVGISVPSFLAVANSPITSSGVIAIETQFTPTGSGAIVLATAPSLTTPNIGAATGTSLTLSSLTAAQSLQTDVSKNLVSIANTGTGSNVMSLSPTITSPILTSPILTSPTIGAASGTSLNLSSLTASQSIQTDASKNLVSLSNNGTGANVLTISPILTTPNIGLASASTLKVTLQQPILEEGLHIQWNRSLGGGESRIINQRGGGFSGGIIFGESTISGVVTDTVRIDPVGNIYMLDHSILLRSEPNFYSGLVYASDIDGPNLYGETGGKLSVGATKIASWNSTAFIVGPTKLRNEGVYSHSPSFNFEIDNPGVAGGRFLVGTDGNTTVGGTLRSNGLFTQNANFNFLIDNPSSPGGRFRVTTDGNTFVGGDMIVDSLTASSIVVTNSSKNLVSLTGTNSQVLTLVGGSPAWATPTFPTVSLTTGVSGILPTANGGTGLSTVGTSGQILTIVSGAPAWASPTSGGVGTVTASSPLASSGGTTPNISISASTGSGSIVLATSPTLVAPILGAATGSSLVLENGVSTLTVGSQSFPTTPTSMLVQNSAAQGLVLGIAGGSGQYSTSAILGDAVIRTTGGRLLLGVDGGAATLTLLSTSSSFTSGIININNPNALPRGIISAYAPNITAATSAYIFMGRDASNHNCTEISFNYQGLNSATNSAGFGLYGPSKFIITGSGNASIPGSFTNGGFDFILGNADQASRGNSGASRALVKNTGNVLTINLGGDFAGGTTVESDLTVTGKINSTVNWQAYTMSTSNYFGSGYNYITGWTAFATPTGYNLTNNGSGNRYFQNNLGRTITVSVAFSIKHPFTGVGVPVDQFRIGSDDSGTLTYWGQSTVAANDYTSITAIVSINNGASIFFDWQNTGGGSQDLNDGRLQFTIH